MSKLSKKYDLELLQREQAFNLYRKLGSLKAVAEVEGMPSYKTLLKWKEEDKWDERIAKIEENLCKWDIILSKLESDSLLKDDVAHLMLLNKLLEKTLHAIIKKDLEPTTWKEAMDTLKMIFEQKRLLLGRSVQKTEIDIDFTSLEEKELRQTLKKVNELLDSFANPLTKSKEFKKQLEHKIQEQVGQLETEKQEIKNVSSINNFLDEIELDEE